MSYLAIAFLSLRDLAEQHAGTDRGQMYWRAASLAAMNIIGETL